MNRATRYLANSETFCAAGIGAAKDHSILRQDVAMVMDPALHSPALKRNAGSRLKKIHKKGKGNS